MYAQLNKDKHSSCFFVCCLDVDRRARFCFVEYDTDTAAQKAVHAENGRDFQGTTLSINHFTLAFIGLPPIIVNCQSYFRIKLHDFLFMCTVANAKLS